MCPLPHPLLFKFTAQILHLCAPLRSVGDFCLSNYGLEMLAVVFLAVFWTCMELKYTQLLSMTCGAALLVNLSRQRPAACDLCVSICATPPPLFSHYTWADL